jgi:DNA-binding IclR family transcriptional regulator
VEAAVSISVPDVRMDKARERDVINELLEATPKMAALLETIG